MARNGRGINRYGPVNYVASLNSLYWRGLTSFLIGPWGNVFMTQINRYSCLEKKMARNVGERHGPHTERQIHEENPFCLNPDWFPALR
jgi:hypothetical protein